jgi:ABC-type sugar transport system substrate-binding protein
LVFWMYDFIRDGIVDATIYQNPFELGRLAFKRLYEIMIQERQPDSILLTPQIVMNCNLETYQRSKDSMVII